MTTPSILVATPDDAAFSTISHSLGRDYSVERPANGQSCLETFRGKRFEITFIDLDSLTASAPQPGQSAPEIAVQSYLDIFPLAQLVVLAEQARIGEALEAVQAGAADYLGYPLNSGEVRHVEQGIRERLLRRSELDYLRGQVWLSDSEEVVAARSPRMRRVFENVKLVAPTRSTVLLTGETGTGKSLIAKLIHRQSGRRNRQFISVHCGAIPENLVESELFGHEKGAFTGAFRKKLGKFEIAGGGTIFLDEIGTLTPAAQIRLLQVLQDKTFQRVGGNAEIEADVRIIAATNENLWAMADRGVFRRDLLYRLNVFPIEIPPLRERLEDIPALTGLFVKHLNKEYLKDIKGVCSEAAEAFQRYDWPGNVRELKNIVERAFIIETTDYLRSRSFPYDFFAMPPQTPSLPVDTSLSLAAVRQKGVEHIEREYLKAVLEKNRGRINKAAENADISTRQLHKLMLKYGLAKEKFK